MVVFENLYLFPVGIYGLCIELSLMDISFGTGYYRFTCIRNLGWSDSDISQIFSVYVYVINYFRLDFIKLKSKRSYFNCKINFNL